MTRACDCEREHHEQVHRGISCPRCVHCAPPRGLRGLVERLLTRNDARNLDRNNRWAGR